MKLNCKNNCKIKGLEENVRRLHLDLTEKGYDMNKHVPLKNPNDVFERSEMWGSGSKIDLEYSIATLEEPTEIHLSASTDAPIEQFWRHLSGKYKVDIDYCFYNEEVEFIGIHKYSRGILTECRYDEDPKSETYRELVLEAGFTLPETKKAVIISFEDLVKRGNKND